MTPFPPLYPKSNFPYLSYGKRTVVALSPAFSEIRFVMIQILPFEVLYAASKYHIKGNKAFYSPMSDMIQLPLVEQFTNINEYYSTATHESVHSTMKETRCNRAEERKGKIVAFGSEEYSKEELVSEIGAASLMNILGIETNKTFRNSTAYIQGWLNALKNEPRWIVSASSRAEKAVEYILNGKQ